MTGTPCMSCGEPRDQPAPKWCLHWTSHADPAPALAIGELEAIADRLRLTMNRLRQERDFGGYTGRPYSPLPWSQLTESERNQWRDHARACVEVMR